MPKSPIVHLQHHQQEHSASCLAACVVMILSSWQIEVTEAEVRRIIRTKPYSGAHPVNLLRLGELGFLGWPFEGTVDDLQQRLDRGIPLIAFLWTGSLAYWAEKAGVDYLHAVVVVGWTETSVYGFMIQYCLKGPPRYRGPNSKMHGNTLGTCLR